MNKMFFDSPFNQDIGAWDVSNVTECTDFSLETPSWVLTKPNFTSCTPYSIGDLIEGGVVFYIAPTPTDLDGDGILDRGLVCALNDEPTLLSWGCSGTDLPSVPNVTSASDPGAQIGDGMSNTNGILNDCPDAPAALACRSLGLDWFLPSINELKELYINRVAINVAAVANGGSPLLNLPSSYYWTSTEGDNGNGTFAHQFSDNGGVGVFLPIFETHVRAVRAF